MRVLFVTPYLPAPPDFGGARRMYALMKETARRHDVVNLSLLGPGDDPRETEAIFGRVISVPVEATARMPATRSKRRSQIQSLLSRASYQHRLYRHAAMQHEIERVVRQEQIDVVQFEFSQMGAYRAPSGVPVVLDVHNIEHDVLRQMAESGPLARRIFNAVEWRKFRREETAAWRHATRCVATSEIDAAAIRRASAGHVEVIPNGVDLDEFPRLPLNQADPNLLVFIGAMRYAPNTDGARFLIEEILPTVRSSVPDVRVAIVGADPPDEVSALSHVPGVQVTGTVADVRPWLRQAAIVVVPLRSGGGTRLKILEAFASGRPVVSTTIGATGIDVRDGEHLLLANTPAEFAMAISRLATDEPLSERLVDNAYRLVTHHYSWLHAGERLHQVYRALAP